MSQYAIICVDDEQIVLEGLNAQLSREFGKQYLIEIAQSAQEALELIEEFQEDQIEVPVLITDQIMPGMKGSELLQKVKQISTSTLSILLTGQAGVEEVGDALNRGNLYRYMAKPWERADLVLTVQEALKSYTQRKEIEKQNRQLKEYAEHLEEMVQVRTKELEEEKEKSEKLLLSILPEETAAELIAKGTSPPRSYGQVSILFTDFVGFTSQASQITPTELVASLEECFGAFDHIVEKHRLEKIKTIGDAYMCAGGIPVANTTNPFDTLQAAFAMRDWLDAWNVRRAQEGKAHWEMRVGIHTGELVAGVIGNRKFAYDVWGDAVNIASRMESHGSPGKINISESLYHLVQGHFAFEDRGEIPVKHKGMMKMYFAERLDL